MMDIETKRMGKDGKPLKRKIKDDEELQLCWMDKYSKKMMKTEIMGAVK